MAKSKRVKPTPNQQAIAERIASVLFREGTEYAAGRLVIEKPGVLPVSAGWAKGPMADIIAEELAKAAIGEPHAD
jgi:hypothetical protein